MKPKVSVIIPVYGVEKYIERCARSLFEQTLDDIEFIFFDDCTKDRSIEILKHVVADYPKREKQVTIYHNKKNLGQAKTRIKALEKVTGDYVIHCDSDDWIAPDMYESLYSKASSENLDIVWCDFYRVHNDNCSIDLQAGKGNSIEAIKDILTGRRMGTLWNHLVRKDIITRNNYLTPESNLMEDATLLIQYYYNAERVGYLQRPLYNYFHSKQSVTSEGQQEKMLWQVREMSKNLVVIERFLKQVGLYAELKYYVDYRKYFDKRWLLPVITKTKDCQLWLDTHPEINCSLFFNPLLTYYDKRTCLLVETRLYPMLKKIIKG